MPDSLCFMVVVVVLWLTDYWLFGKWEDKSYMRKRDRRTTKGRNITCTFSLNIFSTKYYSQNIQYLKVNKTCACNALNFRSVMSRDFVVWIG